MTRIMCSAAVMLATVSVALAAGDAAAGKAPYDKACKACHGATGAPNPGIAKSLKLEMLHLGDPAVQKLSDDELKGIIVNGKGKMKGVKSVTGKAVDDVVAYMRTLKK